MGQYFPKPFNSHFSDSITVKIDLSNYATKADIKNISHVDTSRKLSNAVTNEVVKKTKYDKLVAKVDNTDIIDFVLKTKYNTGKQN